MAPVSQELEPPANPGRFKLALLNRLTADSMATRKSLTALRDTMPAVDKFDGPTCANSLRIQKTHPLRGLNQLVRNDQFPGGVSAELYLVMVDAQQALNLYYAALKDLEPSDCTDANRARQFLVGITTDAIDQLGAVLGRSKELAAGLESSIGVR